jgi:flavodoxin
MKRILVVYYSRSGHTAFVAEQIARRCRADLVCIHDPTDRRGAVGYLRSALEALLDTRPLIELDLCRPQDYDLVMVGTPVWFWNMSSPVRSFLHRYGRRCAQIALFCTYGGSGQERVMDSMERLCKQPAVARLALTERQVVQRQHALALTRFLGEIKRWHRLSDSGQTSQNAGRPHG